MKLTDMIKLGSKGFKPADIKSLGESGIETDEIIKLAENGYSVADINELISLAGSEESLQPGNNEHVDPDGLQDHSGNEGEKSKSDNTEALKNEVEELKKKLASIQDQNASRNLGGSDPEDPRKEVQNIFRQIY